MALASPALIVSNPRAFSGGSSSCSVKSLHFTSCILSQTVALSRNLHGLRRSFEPFYSSLSIWASRVPRRSFVVNAFSECIALRGLFIIDKEGVIQHSTINNLAIGRNVDETMRTLQALQYAQDNPDEVCPAGWKPGEKSMKPDPKLSKEYFAAI